MTRQDLGQWGELYVYKRLIESGYRVKFGQRGRDSDLVLERGKRRVQIEVKAATRGKDGKWRATLIKTGSTSTDKADLVILVCQAGFEIVFFVIPIQAIRGKRHLVITSHPKTYAGRFARYRTDSLVKLSF